MVLVIIHIVVNIVIVVIMVSVACNLVTSGLCTVDRVIHDSCGIFVLTIANAGLESPKHEPHNPVGASAQNYAMGVCILV